MLNESVCVSVLLSETCPTVTPSNITAAVGDTVKMSCWVNYHGSVAPQLQWTPGGTISDPSNTSTVISELSVNIVPAITPVQSHNCSATFTTPVSPQCPTRQSTLHVSCMCSFFYLSKSHVCSCSYGVSAWQATSLTSFFPASIIHPIDCHCTAKVISN